MNKDTKITTVASPFGDMFGRCERCDTCIIHEGLENTHADSCCLCGRQILCTTKDQPPFINNPKENGCVRYCASCGKSKCLDCYNERLWFYNNLMCDWWCVDCTLEFIINNRTNKYTNSIGSFV